jgi:thymidylate kinase
MESASEEVFQRIREGFAALCKSEPKRIFRVDGTQSVDQVWQDVKTAVRAGSGGEHWDEGSV